MTSDNRFCRKEERTLTIFRRLSEIRCSNHEGFVPPPRTDGSLNSMENEKIFFTLYAKSCDWQSEVHKGDREKTAFSSFRGLYQFYKNALLFMKRSRYVSPHCGRIDVQNQVLLCSSRLRGHYYILKNVRMTQRA